MIERPRILVTNAEERSILAVCRSLNEHGYDVTSGSTTGLAPARWSRATRWRARTAGVDDERFVDSLCSELTRRRYAALIAGSDASLLAISRGRERLERLTSLGLPPAPIVERALDRSALGEAAEQVGFEPIRSIPCVCLEEALAAMRELGRPVVLKSPTATPSHGPWHSVPKGAVVASEEELEHTYPAFHDGVLVQRHMPGEVISVGGVLASGRLLGIAVSRYRRTWPPTGGSASFAETITPPPGLEELTLKLMLEIGWQGVFELETIRSGSGTFVAIDLNPRPYGSMGLAAGAGVHLASLWCDWLLGRDPKRARAGAGYRYRWEDGELRCSYWQLRRRHFRSALAPLRPERGVINAHFRLNDPLPLFARGVYLVMRAAQARRSLAAR